MVELIANSPTLGYASPITTLAAPITTAPAPGTVETCTTNAPALPALQGGQFRITLVDVASSAREIILVTSGQNGTTWTITRGVEGSTTVTHPAGAAIYHIWTAAGLATAFDASGSAALAIQKTNNLNDVANPVVALANLGGSQATSPTAPQTGTVAAVAGQDYAFDISGGSGVLNLPSAPPDKTRIGWKITQVSGTPGSTTLTINRGGTDVFNVAGGSTSLSASALFQGSIVQYSAALGLWLVQSTDTPLGVALGAAKTGTDNTVGGPSGTPLSSSVVSASSNVIFADSYYGNVVYASNSAALQAALAAAMASAPATLRFTAGKVYALDTAPLTINRNLAGLNIDLGGGEFGVGGATIQLSSGAPRAFDFNKIADYDTFQNVSIRGGIVDRNNLTGTQNHVVIGIWHAGVWQTNLNLSNVHVSDMRIVNAPITDGLLTIGVGIDGSNTSAWGSGTQTSILGCTATRIYSDGCMQLISVAGAHPQGANTTANVWDDLCEVDGIRHMLPTTPTTPQAGGHVNAATKGQGGKIIINDVIGQNATDCAIECDGHTAWWVTNFDITDAYDFAIYSVNYNAPEDVELQQGFIQGVVRYVNVLHGQGIKIGDVNNNPWGRPSSVHLDVTYQRNTPGASTSASNGLGEALDVYGARRVTGIIRSTIEFGSYSSSTAISPSAVYLHAPDTTVNSAVKLDIRSRALATIASTGLINWRTLVFRDGLFIDFDIDVYSDLALTSGGNAAVTHADLGSVSGSAGAWTACGRLSVKIPTAGGSGNTPVGISFESASFNAMPQTGQEIVVHDCDFGGLASASTNVNFAGATTLASKVRFVNNNWKLAPQARQAISATGSTNLTGLYDYIGVTATGASKTLVLPLISAVPPGRVISIGDEGGDAATNNIVVTVASAGTFAGGTSSKTINANGGGMRFVAGASTWIAF